MDILDRINELQRERNWSMYRLSQESGVPQSTISSWYGNKKDAKPSSPSVDSLDKICKAYGITLSQFFLVDSGEETVVTLTSLQYRVVQYFSHLNTEQASSFLTFLEQL